MPKLALDRDPADTSGGGNVGKGEKKSKGDKEGGTRSLRHNNRKASDTDGRQESQNGKRDISSLAKAGRVTEEGK